MRLIKISPIALLLLVMAGCGSDSPTDGGDGPRITPQIITESAPGALTTTFDVEWSPNTVVLSAADVRDIELDTVTGIYYLPTTVAAAQGLQAGQIVIFTGVDFRKVTEVTEEDGERAIKTTRATLTEAIDNGTVVWEYTPDFDKAAPPTIIRGHDETTAQKWAFNPAAAISTKLAKFDFSIEIGCPQEDSLFVKVTGTDPTGLSEFSLTGGVSEFTGKGEFRIIDNELMSFSYLLRDINASLTKEMTIGNEPLSLSTGELPVTLFKFPFLVGPLPMELQFPLVFAAEAIIPIGGKVTTKTTTEYSLDVGYVFEPPATLDPLYVEKSVRHSEDSAEYVANAAGSAAYAIGFPRVEWSFLGLNDYSAYYVQLAYRLWGNYSQNDLAGNTCREAGRTFAGVGGFYADLFGLAGGEWFTRMFAIDDKFFSEGC